MDTALHPESLSKGISHLKISGPFMSLQALVPHDHVLPVRLPILHPRECRERSELQEENLRHQGRIFPRERQVNVIAGSVLACCRAKKGAE